MEAADVQISRDGEWRWFFTFREQVLAQAEEGYASEGKAKAAAAVFARDVGVALKTLPAFG